MKKILLTLMLIGAIAMFEPRTRERILGLFPTLNAVTQQRSAERAVTQIALHVVENADATGAYPQPRGFSDWLESSRQPRQDPWGADYYLELYPDSFVVGSSGPDAKRRNADDVRLMKLRGPDAEHLRPGYSPPAPPASGVKSSALRNAKEAATRDKH